MDSIGRYQILGELGRGAMGVVYRALDPAIGRPVAIKTIKLAEFTDTTERSRLRDRLFREAQSAGILSHPGIVVVYDVGEQDELTYIAMEFVNGQTLEKRMLDENPPDAQLVLNVLRQTAAALDYAHKKGIVHRDIKPANIMLDDDGTVKITDFGVAKIATAGGTSMTQAGTVLGTPNYMSPEQVHSKPVDGHADQFSLGVVAYELLTGDKPFAGEHLTTVLYKIVSEEPIPPQHINPSLGFPVSVVLSRALAKDPAKRYPTCTEFITALDAALKTKKGWKPLPRGASQGMETAVIGTPLGGSRAQTHPSLKTHGKRPIIRQLLAAVVAALGVAALLFVVAQRWFTASEAEVKPPGGNQQAEVVKPTPSPTSRVKPSPSVPLPTPEATETPTPDATPTPRPTSAVAETPRPTPRPTVPPVGRQGPLQVTTNPAGATVLLDNDPSKTCTSPCTFQVESGRHTLLIELAGYRPQRKILEMRGDSREEFVGLERSVGAVFFDSTPQGAQIIIDNQVQSQTTPARIDLPVGRHRIGVSKDGRRVDQEIDVHDGVLLTFRVPLS